MLKNEVFSTGEKYYSETPFEFSKHSSIGCGGRARIGYYPDSVEGFVQLIFHFRKEGIKYHVVGNMTNILPTDYEIETPVICTKKLDGIYPFEKGIYAYAGATPAKLLKACKKWKKTGLEFLTGIPCTLGGALFMNAGAGGEYLSSVVESVTVIREEGLTTLSLEECGYAYKSSNFMQNGDVIVGAKLLLEESNDEEIEGKIKYFSDRRAHLPKGKSMGCVFKNPEGGFAGEYIEKCGLKGLRIGGAKISCQHANFIINDGKATAEEIKSLIDFIKNAVYAQYKIKLEEEIRYLF